MILPKHWLTDLHGGNDRAKVSLIVALIILISAFHFGTSTESRYLHEIYQRIYYIPILLASFWYGPFSGVCSALVVSIIYVFHIEWDWHHTPVYTFNQYAEICLYHVVALIIGTLSLKEKKQRRQLESTSKELTEAYRKLQTTFEQLRRADRLAALGELSAGIAHEIRNPLGSIKGSVEILAQDIPPSHTKYEFIEIIKEETARLNEIVTEFLKFARPPEPSVQRSSVVEILQSTIALVQQEADKSGVKIDLSLDQPCPPLQLDPHQIRQVFLNVMINAVHAMADGGILQILSRSVASPPGVIVDFVDSGHGVPEESLEHIFDPFFSTKPDGTGLGLAISYQVIEKHGGRISAFRNDGSGLTVRIEFPLETSAGER